MTFLVLSAELENTTFSSTSFLFMLLLRTSIVIILLIYTINYIVLKWIRFDIHINHKLSYESNLTNVHKLCIMCHILQKIFCYDIFFKTYYDSVVGSINTKSFISYFIILSSSCPHHFSTIIISPIFIWYVPFITQITKDDYLLNISIQKNQNIYIRLS